MHCLGLGFSRLGDTLLCGYQVEKRDSGRSVWRDITKKMDKQVEKKMKLGTEAVKLSFKYDFLKLLFCDYSNHVV